MLKKTKAVCTAVQLPLPVNVCESKPIHPVTSMINAEDYLPFPEIEIDFDVIKEEFEDEPE